MGRENFWSFSGNREWRLSGWNQTYQGKSWSPESKVVGDEDSQSINLVSGMHAKPSWGGTVCEISNKLD